jgi:WXG100 family type VII secretion target
MNDQTVDISPEVLFEASNAFAKAKEDNQKQIKELEDAIKKVQAAWPNAAKQGFFQTYKLWEEHVQGFSILLDQIAMDLHAIAERFQETDKF